MRELDLYMDAEGWETMYTILYKAVSKAVDRLKLLPGNDEVCAILVEAMLKAGRYQVVVQSAVSGESERTRLQKRQEMLQLLGVDVENLLTEL